MSKTLPLVLALALAGCSFTPDYQRPEAPVSAAWPATVPNGTQRGWRWGFARSGFRFAGERYGERRGVATDWRAFFPDPRLQDLIAAALEHNRDLRIAVARVDEARALAGIARADRFPTLGLAASAQPP